MKIINTGFLFLCFACMSSAGDVVAIVREITIEGCVPLPGRYKLEEGENLKAALKKAGSLMRISDKEHIYIVRGSGGDLVVIQVDYTGLLEERSDCVLLYGDRILIPVRT